MPLRTLASIVFAVALGCGDPPTSTPTPAICDEIQGAVCTENCAPVLTRCAFEGVEATEWSCPDGCKARITLLAELCQLGSEVTRAEAEAGMTCEPVEDSG